MKHSASSDETGSRLEGRTIQFVLVLARQQVDEEVTERNEIVLHRLPVRPLREERLREQNGAHRFGAVDGEEVGRRHAIELPADTTP